MTTLSVVPVASSVLRLLGTKHDTSSWRGTQHHVLQKTCCRPLCAAGQECLALLGSERPREAVGPKLREGTVLGLGERRPPPLSPSHSTWPGSSSRDQEDSQRGIDTGVRSAPGYLESSGEGSWFEVGIE